MRSLPLILLASVLAGCSTDPQPPAYAARAEATLQKALAGKVAGQPVECLPSFRTQDMIRVNEDTVLFRDGANRVYRNDVVGSCNGLASTSYALVTSSPGGSGRLCRGDIARVMDISNGTAVGSCALGQFVPYTRR